MIGWDKNGVCFYILHMCNNYWHNNTCSDINIIIASNINTVFARPTSLEVPLSFDLRHHCHSHLVTGPLQHCRRVEGTGGGPMEETAAALSAASPSVDGMPSSFLCQPR